ncbi:hypothetical protein E4U43_008546 [Claviceps pusilla]|uniref:Uncharacterized protein n=1 Tax=Claviceps pusilla TaxID=123648 RepID=A0A9P7T0L2_9HYPO|nr:hypothetical protein E4U43_008546 [Claviceps pusilla]
MTANTMIRTHKMRYTSKALESFQSGATGLVQHNGHSAGHDPHELFSSREWNKDDQQTRPPQKSAAVKRQLGKYPLTSAMAAWVYDVFAKYKPSQEALDLVRPFSAELHGVFIKEHAASRGWHDLRMMELMYQVSLEVGGEILIAATANGHAVSAKAEFHSSRAARDDHFSPWGKLLTGLVCEPPIISQFPFYLMTCQAFGFERESSQEDYVYSALTGMDWVKGKNAYSNSFMSFEKSARAAVPNLDDRLSGQDRSFWRVSLAYLDAMNKAENSRDFTTPRHSYIKTGLDPYLLMAVRGIDTIGTAYMCSDGAAYLDDAGMDSLIGSALPNDVMDLHTDISTGETRNLLRLLYPNGQSIEQTVRTMSTVLSGMLCETFRGHKRARFEGREDGRISATSPSYSFCRARHRRIFETLEVYSSKYDRFWDWTWEIYRLAKEQSTEAGLNELLVDALHRGIDQKTCLPETEPRPVPFFDLYFDMVEAGERQMRVKQPLGVCSQLADITREIYSLWHTQLLDPNKKPGWGREFDNKSDLLLKQAGDLLGSMGTGITDDMYKFAIAFGRLSMGLPYIAYHAIGAIIMAYGVELC